jgi:hypothetical protein
VLIMVNQKRHRPRQQRPSAYNAYRVTSPCHETKVIFAAGLWSAVGFLLQWRKANGIGEVPLKVDPTWAHTLTGVGRQHVEGACSLRRLGMGVCYRADIGWGVGGPDDEWDETS